ncbi:MAG TPA: hypothetical protein VEY71_12550 [Chitinophagales bacterium]|nr:hypothetical protein [Chitinophagales bacterium]
MDLNFLRAAFRIGSNDSTSAALPRFWWKYLFEIPQHCDIGSTLNHKIGTLSGVEMQQPRGIHIIKWKDVKTIRMKKSELSYMLDKRPPAFSSKTDVNPTPVEVHSDGSQLPSGMDNGPGSADKALDAKSGKQADAFDAEREERRKLFGKSL